MNNKILKFFLLPLALQQFCYAQINNGNDDIPIISTSSFNEVEHSVFISPLDKNIILNANNRIYPNMTSQVDAFVSTNGAQLWSPPTTLFSSRGDPAVVIGRNGYKYVLFVNYSIQLGMGIHNGISWSTSPLPSPSYDIYCTDKPHLWIDNRLYKQDGSSNINEGNLYAASGLTNIIFFSYDSQTWYPQCTTGCSSCQIISSGISFMYYLGVNVQTGPNAEVYACWAGWNSSPGWETAILFNQSNNAGQNWVGDSYAINNIRGIYSASGLPGKSMNVRSYPSMTVNQQNGYIFIVWANQGEPCGSINPPGCNNPVPPCTTDVDIYMIRSTDGGATWEPTPIRVNQDAVGNCMDQWFPWIACDEASGALVCTYYGSQDCSSGNNDCANTYVSISYDQGTTWTETRISDVEWGGEVTFTGLDYIGVDVYHGKAIPVWADDRTPGIFLSYTNPFEVPCPQNLNLTYGNYFITNEKIGTIFTYDAAYSAISSINVAGSGSTYKIYPNASVLMTAGDEIVLDDGFESEGEFYAYTAPCSTFSQRTAPVEPPKQLSPPVAQLTPKPSSEINKPVNNFPLSIYPNPSADGRIISSVPREENNTENIPAILFIYNTTGEMIYQSKINNEIAEINLSSHPQGLYLLKVIKGDKIYTEKIILQ